LAVIHYGFTATKRVAQPKAARHTPDFNYKDTGGSMATVTVCKACGTFIGQMVDGDGVPTCGDVFCVGSHDHNVPVEVEVPDLAHCSDCGQAATYEGGSWLIGYDKPAGRGGFRNARLKELPFYDPKTRTFYCGCRGWE